MPTITIGNTTIHFAPLIVFMVVACVAFIFYISILAIRNRQLNKAFMSGKYSEAVKIGTGLFKIYSIYSKRTAPKKAKLSLENLNYILAVSYYSTSEDELFLKHINSLLQYKNTKEFWLTLYYIQHNEVEIAKEHFEAITLNTETQTNITFLESAFLNLQGDVDNAKNKMSTIYDKLNLPVLKEFANGILNSNPL